MPESSTVPGNYSVFTGIIIIQIKNANVFRANILKKKLTQDFWR